MDCTISAIWQLRTEEWSLCASPFPLFSHCRRRGGMPFLFRYHDPTCTVRNRCPIVKCAIASGAYSTRQVLALRESTEVDQPSNADELAAAAYQKAAEEILRRAPNTRASAVTDELPMTGQIPLPKNRPIAR